MGDGINDKLDLNYADTSISVVFTTDVVKEAADFVLLEKDLAVLAKRIEEGRKNFANTFKYAFMPTITNIGNTFSMDGRIEKEPVSVVRGILDQIKEVQDCIRRKHQN